MRQIEAGSSVLVSIKTKYRNRLNIKLRLPLALSDIEPRLEKLVSAKQAQKYVLATLVKL